MSADRGLQAGLERAERVRGVLATRALTLRQVSDKSKLLYGHPSPYVVPHNLYYDLRLPTFSPSIHQIFTLSKITNYRLTDWFRALGFDLALLPHLQIALSARRTVLLNSDLDDQGSWIPWVGDKGTSRMVPPIAPLADLVAFTHHRPIRTLAEIVNGNCLYAKIGQADVLAFPELVPGSIVRVRPGNAVDKILRRNGAASRQLVLIEHCKGLFCSRLRLVGDNLLVPVNTLLTYAQVELHVPSEAVILGVADLEIRPAFNGAEPEVPEDLARQWKPAPLHHGTRIGELLRAARSTMKLSLRDASAMSRTLADLLGDNRFFVSQSSLCDYEVLDSPPRHFHKAIALCAIYGLNFHHLLRCMGLIEEDAGLEPMPDDFIPERQAAGKGTVVGERPQLEGFVGELLKQSGPIPLFLRKSLRTITGLHELSLNHVFWTGGEETVLNPNLAGALLVAVNRRRRKPVHLLSRPPWQQPLYLLQKRDGSYVCASCSVENGSLVVHPYSERLYRPTRFPYPQEVEVIGQIVAIARRLQ